MDAILGKYFDGSITGEELAVLSKWIVENEENKRKFLVLYRAWNSIEFKSLEEAIDVAGELEIFKANIRAGKTKSKMRRLRIIIASAAACLLLPVLITGIWYITSHYRYAADSIMSFVDDSTAPEFTGAKDISLMLSNGRKINLYSVNPDIKYGDGCVTVEDSGETVKKTSSGINQLLIPYGKRTTVTFSDGTKVWASAGTRLVYPAEFDKKVREIFVDGKIYLDVAEEAGRPFVVRTRDMDVKVLGTEFIVTAYGREDRNDIVLVSGKVAVSNKITNSNTTLLPDKMYVYDKTLGDEQVKDIDAHIYTSWIYGKYIFEKETFANVLNRLSMYYGVKTDCEPAAGEYLCSGKLNLKDGFDTVLRGLSNVVPISYSKENDTYRIKLSKESW